MVENHQKDFSILQYEQGRQWTSGIPNTCIILGIQSGWVILFVLFVLLVKMSEVNRSSY